MGRMSRDVDYIDEYPEDYPAEPYRCAGWASDYGPCGADDCATCNPCTWNLDPEDEDEE